MSDKEIIEVADYRGKIVIFTKRKWEQKRCDHPELQKKTFLECVKRAIMNPDEVWENYSDKDKRCYYKKHSEKTYVKVVIWIKCEPCQVVTAYEIDKIKESSYPNLKRLL